MTEEQAKEIAAAVEEVAMDAAEGGPVLESRQRLIGALMALPTVGTPEYVPTGAQPTRLSGGAN